MPNGQASSSRCQSSVATRPTAVPSSRRNVLDGSSRISAARSRLGAGARYARTRTRCNRRSAGTSARVSAASFSCGAQHLHPVRLARRPHCRPGGPGRHEPALQQRAAAQPLRPRCSPATPAGRPRRTRARPAPARGGRRVGRRWPPAMPPTSCCDSRVKPVRHAGRGASRVRSRRTSPAHGEVGWLPRGAGRRSAQNASHGIGSANGIRVTARPRVVRKCRANWVAMMLCTGDTDW